MRAHALISAAAVASLASMPAYAQDATWRQIIVGSGDFNRSGNWDVNTVPTGTAFFGPTNNTTLFLSAPTTLGGWTFNAVAPAYSFSTINQPLQFNGAGIVINGGSVTIDNTGGSVQFLNSSTAGGATIANNIGILQFSNTATAGNATIANASVLSFFDTSTAGNAAITSSVTGSINFNGTSTAANASIVNRGSFNFNGTSTAGNATITNDANGALRFNNSATAGTATINNNGATVQFFSTSTAGSAIIINNIGVVQFLNSSAGGTATIANASVLSFFDTSAAGNAAITNSVTGSLNFNAASTAANASIVNRGSFNFNATSTAGNAIIANDGTLNFNDTSTAGNAVINNGVSDSINFNATSTAANASITNGGTLHFNNDSTAGSASITNNVILDFSESSSAGSATIINPGNATFRNNSTAANATITNSGDLFFRDNATAANANITNSVGSELAFLNATTAGNATITNNAGGIVSFLDNSTGGNAAFTNSGGGLVDFSASTGPAGDNKLTAGSIAGAGTFLLGANELTVGGNNLSTEVSGVISGVAGGSLVKVGAGTLTLSGTSTYTGATSVNAGTLRAGAPNTLSSSSAMSVASSGTLDLNSFNQTLVSVANAGLVNMGTRTAPGTVLTTTSYAGIGGTIAMHAVLGTDNSPSDKLVINGGQASGNSLLRIANAGGLGDLTAGNGIQVVSTIGGGTTVPGTFALGGIVAAGAYEYRLFQGGTTPGAENDWFLRSTAPPGTIIPPDPTIPPGPIPPNPVPPNPTPPNPIPPGPGIPLFRPEAAVYALLPGVARQLGLTTLGTFHERQGDQTLLRGSGALPGAWGRVFGGYAEERRSGRLAPEFEGDVVGFQIGQDLYGWDTGAHRDRLGLFFGYARADVETRGFALAQQSTLVGDLPMDSTSFGAYWTHLGPSNWYVDTMLMASWFDGDPRSTRGVGLSADGTGFTASVEAGYPIPIGAGWALEPQGQLIWQRVKFDQAQDPFATVGFDPDEALTGRIGARVFGDAVLSNMTLKPYFLASVWHTFSGGDTTTFNITSIETGFGRTSLEVGGGVIAQLSPRIGMYAGASYLTNLGGEHRQGIKGNIEVRITW